MADTGPPVHSCTDGDGISSETANAPDATRASEPSVIAPSDAELELPMTTFKPVPAVTSMDVIPPVVRIYDDIPLKEVSQENQITPSESEEVQNAIVPPSPPDTPPESASSEPVASLSEPGTEATTHGGEPTQASQPRVRTENTPETGSSRPHASKKVDFSSSLPAGIHRPIAFEDPKEEPEPTFKPTITSFAKDRQRGLNDWYNPELMKKKREEREEAILKERQQIGKPTITDMAKRLSDRRPERFGGQPKPAPTIKEPPESPPPLAKVLSSIHGKPEDTPTKVTKDQQEAVVNRLLKYNEIYQEKHKEMAEKIIAAETKQRRSSGAKPNFERFMSRNETHAAKMDRLRKQAEKEQRLGFTFAPEINKRSPRSHSHATRDAHSESPGSQQERSSSPAITVEPPSTAPVPAEEPAGTAGPAEEHHPVTDIQRSPVTEPLAPAEIRPETPANLAPPSPTPPLLAPLVLAPRAASPCNSTDAPLSSRSESSSLSPIAQAVTDRLYRVAKPRPVEPVVRPTPKPKPRTNSHCNNPPARPVTAAVSRNRSTSVTPSPSNVNEKQGRVSVASSNKPPSRSPSATPVVNSRPKASPPTSPPSALSTPRNATSRSTTPVPRTSLEHARPLSPRSPPKQTSLRAPPVVPRPVAPTVANSSSAAADLEEVDSFRKALRAMELELDTTLQWVSERASSIAQHINKAQETVSGSPV
eukprot:TRINITY_DN20234_c0_g1_i1.p1 TRINITY_DN20234_c0_g1~~TRINITY_DN20234_c0_g1_i1.p1  ORF type:complete len:715 (-),score=84.33 TRINITY_DN20234_c0_g1_i1:3-2117(-)